ncbi:hypothetical protein HMPREF3201_02350 [Megasphaera sp. MJR8396C]|nr:hypothetical protein HMPREF3201_02350 [Megasphaera sp. MJR8396C]
MTSSLFLSEWKDSLHFISNNQNHKYKNSPKTCMIKKYRLFSFMIIKHGL